MLVFFLIKYLYYDFKFLLGSFFVCLIIPATKRYINKKNVNKIAQDLVYYFNLASNLPHLQIEIELMYINLQFQKNRFYQLELIANNY